MRHSADTAPDEPAVSGVRGAEPAPRSRRVRAGVGGAVVLLIVAAVIAVLVSAAAQGGGSVVTPSAVALRETSPVESAPPGSVLVHVTGAVRRPGLVSLAAGARVVDAVAAAGGVADDADVAAVNLARPVADGEQLAIPKVGDPPAGAAVGSGSAVGSGAAAGSAPVNLNTATQAELEGLPRIGPALAQRIVDWRQANGRFAQPSDLLKVSGIGQKLFDGLKDRVVV
ncbi:ComEA family DNA-binding protein [Leifsonia virtsii]|uniref:Helix-hairpin-helix domain-containing protein n=1 Tax=Leifsonia virtsii TaxID=3035915 RepID=A0ABT8ITZ3_9MICO|nr:helix-hairpin-helix domain-containing protein [Leifsonia virtsii]MDN4596261.1 helix-hairpin-helix domain-containing protein [Leifsonia virtsii]